MGEMGEYYDSEANMVVRHDRNASIVEMDTPLPPIGEQRVTRNHRLHTVIGVNKWINTLYTVHVPTEGEPYMQHWRPEQWYCKTTEPGAEVTKAQMVEAMKKAGLDDLPF